MKLEDSVEASVCWDVRLKMMDGRLLLPLKDVHRAHAPVKFVPYKVLKWIAGQYCSNLNKYLFFCRAFYAARSLCVHTRSAKKAWRFIFIYRGGWSFGSTSFRGFTLCFSTGIKGVVETELQRRSCIDKRLMDRGY